MILVQGVNSAKLPFGKLSWIRSGGKIFIIDPPVSCKSTLARPPTVVFI
jgi:hypothetical protein